MLNIFGYTTRKLGDVDKGLDHLPKGSRARSKLLARAGISRQRLFAEGELAKAKEQLTERCGGSCEEYGKLEQAIVTFVTGEPNSSSWQELASRGGFFFDALYVGVGEAEMMAYLMHQHMGDDCA